MLMTFAPVSVWAADACTPVTSVPNEAQLGFANVHNLVFPNDGIKPDSLLFTVGAPFFTPNMSGKILDLTQQKPGDRLPTKFIFGDGGIGTGMLPFVSIDLSPGSSLSRWLDFLLNEMRARGARLEDRESVLSFLKTNIWNLLKDTGPIRCMARLRKAQPFVTQVSQGMFSDMAKKPVGSFVYGTGQTYPVVPFELFIQQFHPLCIHEEFLAAIILDRLGFPFQIVMGYEAETPHTRVTGGHTWLRVDANRELDVEWNRLGPPEWNPEVPSWQRVAKGWGGPNAHWPILALDP